MEERIQYLKNKLEKMDYFYGAYPKNAGLLTGYATNERPEKS